MEESQPVARPFWLALIDLRETRRRARTRRAHGHAVTPYPEPGCPKCTPRVVGTWGTR